MKRMILFALTALLLCGCRAVPGEGTSDTAPSTQAPLGPEPGLYVQMDGESLHYLALRGDGTGVLSIDETLAIQWDSERLYPQAGTSDQSYFYRYDGDSIQVPEFGWQLTRDDSCLEGMPELRTYLEKGILPSAITGYFDESQTVYTQLDQQRQRLAQNEAICGVLLLGSADGERPDMAALVQNSGYASDFAFLRELGESQKVIAPDGSFVLCIYPQDPKAQVSVDLFQSQQDAGQISTSLYRSEYGTPLLLSVCSDETRYTQISLVDSQGCSLVWEPALDADGHLNVPENNSPIFDASKYK